MPKYDINSNIFSRKINNHIIILKKGENFCRELNEIASFIWELIQKGKSITNIVRLLKKEYSVGVNVARKDVDNFVRKYVRLGILIERK